MITNNKDADIILILNLSNDITDEIIDRIINNLDSLTINYDFTQCQSKTENAWHQEIKRINLFLKANAITPKKGGI